MVQVTVGVPTYNGEAFLEQCLAGLAMQDHPDFKVVILDNASTDRTPDIAQDMCASDPRFEYHCNPETVPATENFRTVWSLADSPYYLWRADDDLSSSKYLTELARVLDENPDADLAVGQLEKRFEDRSEWVETPDVTGMSAADRAAMALRETIPYWFYGMWRNNGVLAPIWDRQAQYGRLWAWDHLAMLPTLLAGRVEFTTTTTFTQRFLDHEYYLLAPCEKLKARRSYSRLAYDIMAQNAFQSPDLAQALEDHIERRVAKLWSNRRRCALELLSFGLNAKRR